MAKIGLTKLGLKVNQEVKEIEFNEQTIEIKQYLPIEAKLELMSNVINLAMTGSNFANPVQIEVYTTLQIIESYTNINFTDKQKEDVCKLYDLIIGNGLKEDIFNAIPKSELDYIVYGIHDSVQSLYKYRNSLVGMLEAITANYSSVSFDLENIMKQIQDPQALAMLKQILPLLGNINNPNKND